MSKEQTPITAEEFLKKKGYLGDEIIEYDTEEYYNQDDVSYLMKQYAQAKVLEALEREAVDIYFAVRKGCTRDPFKTAEEHAKNYIETEVKPKYER